MTTPLPPALSYLYKPGSAVLGAPGSGGSGNATILLKPDVGQYWLPIIIHVSTRGNTPVRCAVHVGGIGALQKGVLDNTTTKDFTFLGANDTSTILSGSIVEPGEGILFEFTTGSFGEIVFAEVIGLSSSIPPTEGIVPEIPGARFVGSTSSGAQSGILFAANAGAVPGVGTAAGPIDMRGYLSYSLTSDAIKNNTSALLDPVQITLSWRDENTIVSPAFAKTIYEESYIWWADDPAGVYPNPLSQNYGRFAIEDAIHGPFLTIVTTNISTGGLENLSWTTELRGDSRPVGRTYIRNSAAVPVIGGYYSDTIFLIAAAQVLGPGAVVNLQLPLRPGPAHLWANATVAGGIFITITEPSSSGVQLEQFGALPIGNNRFDFVMPSSCARLTIQNTSAGNITLFAGITFNRPSEGT